ncbi:MAG: TRAP transporter small permease [Clostridiales bacterium]|nr:TRAP transporter small permease [Clostridiales bacterium]MCF8022233.1 TRAP transporter small permease [Clostridiales bacterium]
MRLFSGFNLQLEKICKAFIFTVFVIMVITTFSQVVFRFVLSNSLSWSGELSRYCLIWLTFIGGALGVRSKVHVAVEALTVILPEKIRRHVARFNYLVIMIFGVILARYGYKLSAYNLSHNQLSPAMHVPIGLIYTAVPIAGLLIFFFALEKVFYPDEKGGASE